MKIIFLKLLPICYPGINELTYVYCKLDRQLLMIYILCFFYDIYFVVFFTIFTCTLFLFHIYFVSAIFTRYFVSAISILFLPLPIPSFNILRPVKNCQHFAHDISRCIFSNENCCILIHISQKFFPKSQLLSIDSSNGLAPTRWQAITWTKADPVHWWVYASPSLNVLVQIMPCPPLITDFATCISWLKLTLLCGTFITRWIFSQILTIDTP